MKQRPLRLFLSLSLALVSPGITSYQAAAQSLAVPGAAGRPSSPASFAQAPATAQDWAGFVDSLYVSLLDNPLKKPLPSPEFIQALGQARFQLAAGKDPAGVLAFTEFLPRPMRNLTGALIMGQLPLESASMMEAAFKAASEKLEPRAAELLAAADRRELTDTEAEEVRRLAAGFFYLKPDTAKGTQELSSELKADRALGAARNIGAALLGLQTARDASPGVVDTELTLLFQGLEHVAARADLAHRGRLDEENRAIVLPALVSFAEASLGRAGDRMEARGLRRETLLEPLVAKHQHEAVFGALASRELVEVLRASGVWTELVTRLTLGAAESLQRTLAARQARRLFSQAGSDLNLRLKIPEGHSLAPHGTIADWLSSTWGKPYEQTLKGAIPLFTAFGIPVSADKTFLIIYALVTFQLAAAIIPSMMPGLGLAVYAAQGIIGAAVFFASLIAHEFGHALTARLYGVRTTGIILHILGGVAALDRMVRRPLAEFLIAIAGPLVSVALGIGFWLAAAPLAAVFPLAAPVALYLGQINLILAAFNMIPALPMDGGRVFRALAAGFLNDHYKATRAAASIGRAFGTLFQLAGLANILILGNLGGLMMLLLGWFVKSAASQEAVHPGTDTVDAPEPKKS